MAANMDFEMRDDDIQEQVPVNVYDIPSDDDDDDLEVLEERRHNPLHAHSKIPDVEILAQPECIDLTEEGDEDMHGIGNSDDDSDEEVMEVLLPNANKADDDDDMPELVEVPPLSKKELAEDRRKVGNLHFKDGEYNQALAAYTRAIELVPNEASYYGNRAACYMMMKHYKEALADSQQSLRIDSSYEKSYLRLIRVQLSLGDVSAAEAAVAQYENLRVPGDISSEKQKLKELKQFLVDLEASTSKKDFRKVLFLCGRALEIACGDVNLKVRKGYSLIRLGRHSEAGEIAAEVMQIDSHNVDAHVIRALCHYQLDNMEKSLSFLKGALQRNPDAELPRVLYKQVKSMKENRETATQLYNQGKYDDARKLYLECVAACTNEGELKNTCLESKFQFNLSLIFNKLRKYDESLECAGKAISLNQNYYKAFIHRASVHKAKDMYDEAVRDYEAALKLDPSKRELRTEIQSTKLLAKRAKRKDYYKILDIPKTATEEEIRKAYKKRALLHHPDRHASSTEAVQKEQEKHFKDVGEAYEILSDTKKRFRYDQGHDLMEGDGLGGGAGFYDNPYDANQIFNMFFSNGPAAGGGMGGPRYYGGNRHAGGGGRGGCSFNFQR